MLGGLSSSPEARLRAGAQQSRCVRSPQHYVSLSPSPVALASIRQPSLTSTPPRSTPLVAQSGGGLDAVEVTVIVSGHSKIIDNGAESVRASPHTHVNAPFLLKHLRGTQIRAVRLQLPLVPCTRTRARRHTRIFTFTHTRTAPFSNGPFMSTARRRYIHLRL